MILEDFERVNRQHPCPICDHDSWCLVSRTDDGVLCKRVESSWQWGEAGWYHGSRQRSVHQSQKGEFMVDVTGDLLWAQENRMAKHASKLADDHLILTWLVDNLGVSLSALQQLRVRYCPLPFPLAGTPAEQVSYFVFPMYSGHGDLIGWRTRTPQGSKASITGSQSGLFIPTSLSTSDRLYICEGPTDCAAGIDLGLNIIGRPDAQSGLQHLQAYVFTHRPREVVIIADRDASNVGLQGAQKLYRAIRRLCQVTIILPPTKDLRDWVHAGCTRELLEQAVTEERKCHDYTC